MSDTTHIEDEIERRGLWKQYVLALLYIVCEARQIDALHEDEELYQWLLIRATPEQRERAFLKAIEP